MNAPLFKHRFNLLFGSTSLLLIKLFNFNKQHDAYALISHSFTNSYTRLAQSLTLFPDNQNETGCDVIGNMARDKIALSVMRCDGFANEKR